MANPDESSKPRTALRTRFTFTIQVVKEFKTCVEVETISKSARPGHIRKRQPLIFVVDDELHALGYMRGILQNAGYHPLVTGDP